MCLLMTDLVECKKKKKSKSIFKKNKHHKKKAAAAAVTTTTTNAVKSIASSVRSEVSEAIASVKATATSIPTKVKAAAAYHQTYHKKDNLKLVFQTVLPAGTKRPKNNVVFQYTDQEAGKSCRCICRTK